MKPTQIIKDGVIYNVHPSAIGASQLNVTIPEIVIKPRAKYPDTSNYYLWNPSNFLLDKTINDELTKLMQSEKSIEGVRNRIYNTVFPRGYDPLKAKREYYDNHQRGYSANIFSSFEQDQLREALWAKYLQQPFYRVGTGEYEWDISQILPSAIYNPTIGSPVGDLVRIAPYISKENELSDSRIGQMLQYYKNTGNKSMLIQDDRSLLGRYTQSLGKDSIGDYISYYDEWNLNPFNKGAERYGNLMDIVPVSNKLRKKKDLFEEYGISKPFSLYDRRYFDINDSLKFYNAYKESPLYGKIGKDILEKRVNSLSPL